MPRGLRRFLFAAGALLWLGACADDGPRASSLPSTIPTTETVTSQAASSELVETGPVDTGGPATVPVSADPTEPVDSSTPPSLPATTANASISSPSTSTIVTTTIVADPDCAPVVALADAVALAEGIDFSLAWPDLQAAIAASSDAAAQSYLDVLDVAPADVDAALQVLADYNTGLGATARAATSVTEFQATVVAPDNALLDATATVDGYMRTECSIGLSV